MEIRPQPKQEEIIPFAQWLNTIDIVGTVDKPLYSLLKGSRAYLYNNIVYIDGHEALNNYLRGNREAASIVKQAIQQACGKMHNIGGYKNIAHMFEEKKAEDLTDILSLRDSGVEVTGTD